MIDGQTTHFVRKEDMSAWFAEHGVDYDAVTAATIRLDRPTAAGHPIWLDVEFFKKDETGKLFVVTDENGEPVAARGTASIPLSTWPLLLLMADAPTDAHAPVEASELLTEVDG